MEDKAVRSIRKGYLGLIRKGNHGELRGTENGPIGLSRNLSDSGTLRGWILGLVLFHVFWPNAQSSSLSLSPGIPVWWSCSQGREDPVTASVTHIPTPLCPQPMITPSLQLLPFTPTLGVLFSIPLVALLSVHLLSDVYIPAWIQESVG